MFSATFEALFVHPNTRRQWLRRNGDISGIAVRHHDWLMVEIALKMVPALETATPHT